MEPCEQAQDQTFTRWVNHELSKSSFTRPIASVTDLGTDGEVLVNLVRLLTGQPFGRYNRAPKLRIQKLENAMIALRTLKSDMLPVNMNPEDVIGGSRSNLLNLVWHMIVKYHVRSEDPRGEVLAWVKQQVARYGLAVNDFTSDWTDGKVVTALVDSVQPGVITGFDLRELQGNPLQDTQRALSVAAGQSSDGVQLTDPAIVVPMLVDPQVLVDGQDERSVIVYAAAIRNAIRSFDTTSTTTSV
eukprot:TRINITY_DN11848_c0_g1_i1.p1 TRINITY_DN11848_c0_g1~~TRINITY_DN11848_c0_g1_i1.p1  ORF type:complete len:244 (-),score=35.12 TRINITY_DN11848_c0_g1_i1:2-733(-)